MRKYAMNSLKRTQPFNFSFFRSFVTVSRVSVADGGIEMYALANDLTASKYPNQEQNKPCDAYITDSLKTFKSILKPSSYYVFVDKAVKKGDSIPYGGHILSFLTDSQSDVNKNATMSLRPGKSLPNKTLIYTLSHLDIDKKETRSVREVEYYDLEKELKSHFFNQAISDYLGTNRFLIRLPIRVLEMNNSDIIERTTAVKEALSSKWFILFDGKVDNKFVKALNCTTGFYSQNLLSGSEINPSPQMAAWSYIGYFFGQALRDKLIENTGLRAIDAKLERNHDDVLHPISMKDLLSIQSNNL